MSTRPSFQFYARDWLTCPELRRCSVAARGLWADMMAHAHFGTPYGHLMDNGVAYSTDEIARLCGVSPREAAKLVAELERNRVLSRTDDEQRAIYSRRMVRDAATLQARIDGGKLGAEHGQKGASHGASGGRPPIRKGGSSRDGRGVLEPPSNPPPASASASAEKPPQVPHGGTDGGIASRGEPEETRSSARGELEESSPGAGAERSLQFRADPPVVVAVSSAPGHADTSPRAAKAAAGAVCSPPAAASESGCARPQGDRAVPPASSKADRLAASIRNAWETRYRSVTGHAAPWLEDDDRQRAGRGREGKACRSLVAQLESSTTPLVDFEHAMEVYFATKFYAQDRGYSLETLAAKFPEFLRADVPGKPAAPPTISESRREPTRAEREARSDWEVRESRAAARENRPVRAWPGLAAVPPAPASPPLPAPLEHAEAS